MGSQLGSVGTIVGGAGIAPEDIRWWEQPESRLGRAKYVVLIHKPTGFEFRFTEGSRSHEVKYSPGASTHTEEFTRLFWDQVLDHVGYWVTYQLSCPPRSSSSTTAPPTAPRHAPGTAELLSSRNRGAATARRVSPGWPLCHRVSTSSSSWTATTATIPRT